MQPQALTQYLHAEIPLTRAMGISVTASDAQAIALAAPLSANTNHTDTAFGGSIATLGIVAGWTLLHAALQDHSVSARLLIQHSATDFVRPLDSDLRATCAFPDAEALPRFLAGLQSRRRARIELASHLFSRAALAATHHGTYVAILY